MLVASLILLTAHGNFVAASPTTKHRLRQLIAVARRVSAHGVLDIGYVHEFIDDAKINKVGELDGGRLAGTFKSDPNVLTLQYTHSF